MAEETSLVESFIYGRLSADATLLALLGTQTISGAGIFSGYAPKAAVFPIVIFRWISPISGGTSGYTQGSIGTGDLYVNGANRVWSRMRYMVMAVDERTDYEGLAAIASRIDTLLSITAAVAVTGGLILQSIREASYKRPVYEGAGQEFRELGAFWDVIAQAS